MLATLGFLLTISILVVIHEFGHYFFARLFKVKVLTFSLGFGPKIFSWQGRHNKWCLSAIPLGGYVQMLDEREGDVPEAERHLAFNNKPAGQKLLIALAGPLFNILFAFLAYYAMGIYGVSNLKPVILSENPSPLVHNLAQLPSGSTLISINNHSVSSWNEAENELSSALKDGSSVALNYREPSHENESSQLAAKTTTQPASQQLKLDLAKFIANQNEQPSLIGIGLYPFSYQTIISYIEPQSAAANAGLRAGDQITTVNGQAIADWFSLARIIRASPSEKLRLQIIRNQQRQDLNVIVASTSEDNGQIIGKIGIMPTLNAQLLAQNSFVQHYGPLSSLAYAYRACSGLIIANLSMIKMMLLGQVSWHNIGGPVSIAQASQTALHQGVKAFVDLLALISLSLAVMNLLPIPVLDGGHILIYSIEWFRGKPINLKTQVFLFKIGLVLVLSVTFLALYNDFLKLFNL